MSINVAELVKLLQTKDQTAEVEFVVLKTDGEIVVMDIANNAKDMIKVLKFFK